MIATPRPTTTPAIANHPADLALAQSTGRGGDDFAVLMTIIRRLNLTGPGNLTKSSLFLHQEQL
jgi:hypothetical protein